MVAAVMGDRKEKKNTQIQITVAVGLLSGLYVQLLAASCLSLQKRQVADGFGFPHALLLPRLTVLLLLPTCRAFLLPVWHKCSSASLFLSSCPPTLSWSASEQTLCYRARERAVSLHLASAPPSHSPETLSTVTCIDTTDCREKKKVGVHKDLSKGERCLLSSV